MSKSQRAAFFIRSYNDTDHFSPLIAEFIIKDENPLIVVYTDFKYEDDYRFKYLISLGRVEIIRDIDLDFVNYLNKKKLFSRLLDKFYLIKRNRKNLIGKLYRKLFFNCGKQVDILRDKNIGVCAFEWGTPFERGVILEKYFFAAKGMGITTIAIPHGCNIFLNSDVTIGYRKLMEKGVIPQKSDSSLFDYYILQNPIRRDGWIKWGLDPIKTQAWGSLRFYPGWADKNKKICPELKLEKNHKTKVVFMQFQKEYNIFNNQIFETLTQISSIKDISLVVKDATREGKEYYDKNKASGLLGKSLVGWFGNNVHSPTLVEWADIVIVIGGSIGIEAILQNKLLVYPTYLNNNITLYEHFDACYCPKNDSELIKLINDKSNGKNFPQKNGANDLLKEIVYAGNEKFNVPQKYYEKFKSINLKYSKIID
jgi:hypothetical protein